MSRHAIGACRWDWSELDDEEMANVVSEDSREGAIKNRAILSGAKIYVEPCET